MQASVSLLCLPCAGASATMYLRWRKLLPGWIKLVPVELPGRGARLGEAPMQDFDRLVDQLCREQEHAMRGTFALFGHSMGALLAHGLALRLRTGGRPMPCALVVSGSPAPSQRDPARFANKDDDPALIADLRKQGGTPEEVLANGELLRMVLDVLKADYRVCESFCHAGEPPLSLPVHAFGGRQDDIEADRVEAWSREAAGPFTLDWFEGGHFFVRQQEAVVLEVLTRRLADAVGADMPRLYA